MKKTAGNYDSVAKDLFQPDRPSLLMDMVTGGVPVRQVLNVELARVIERRADLVFLLEDESILHLELQTHNDSEMPYRMGIYCLLLGQKYRRRIRQALIYLGAEKLRIPGELDLGQTKVQYVLVDVRNLDAVTLMSSGWPADLPFAMLARGGPERLTSILKIAIGLPSDERQKVLSEIADLCGLRRLEEKLIMELKDMSTVDNFLKVPQFQEIIRDAERNAERNARAQMLRDLLKARFHSLPKWAKEKVESGTSPQLRRWSRKFATAKTLEDVLGKK